MTDEKSEPRTCIVCRRTKLADDQAQTCIGCLNRVRVDLGRIVDGYAILPRYLHTFSTRSPGTGEGGSRNAETPLMGGDVLSLIGYGGDAPGTGLPSDPPSILFELERWEADWRNCRGVPAAMTRATISNTSAWLHANLGWAAQNHPAFEDFASDMRRLRGHVERAMGTEDSPVVAPIPCPYDGGRLIQRWTTSGIEEDRTCVVCRRTYDGPEYWKAVENYQRSTQAKRETV